MKRKDQLREEAEIRQSVTRSSEDQLAYLDRRGYVAKRERARLKQRIEDATAN